MYIRFGYLINVDKQILRGVCPKCKISTIFANHVSLNFASGDEAYACILGSCPAEDCGQTVIALVNRGNHVSFFPTALVPFDSTSIPARITETFSEALVCRANSCYVASGIMLRKTLEMICEETNSGGNNLKDRISNLRTKIMIPIELIDGLDAIRLLGNDAAHVESKTYNTISSIEIDVAIKIVQEVLKGIYQYKNLIDEIIALKST